jgi:hypothetical protein
VLVEQDAAEGVETVFTVDPLVDGRCQVTIATSFADSGGLRGLFERRLVPSALRKVFNEELALLQEIAAG